MYLIFTDESGNTGYNLSDPDQPSHYIGGIYVSYDECIPLQDSIEKIAKDIYDPDPIPDNFEFKGSWLFSGKEFFKQFDPSKRVDITEKLIDLMDFYDIQYIVSAINKEYLNQKYVSPFHPHNLAFLFLLEMFQKKLASDNKFGLVISDEDQARGDEIILDFKKYKEQGTGFCSYKSVELTRIIDNIHFVKSKDSWPIQLSDVVLFHINRYRKIVYSGNYHKKTMGELGGFTQSEEIIIKIYKKIKKHQGNFKVFP